MIVGAQVNPAGSRMFMGTLTGGVDVHASLAHFCRAHRIIAGAFEMLGGLEKVVFTEYDFLTKERKPLLTFARPLEILSGHGTISLLEEEVFVHLHLVVSYQASGEIVVLGGHAAEAKAFAVEFTLQAYDGNPVRRAMHVGTGLRLWTFPAGDAQHGD